MKVLNKKMGGFLKSKSNHGGSKIPGLKLFGLGKKDPLDVDTALIDAPTGIAPTTAMESLAAHTLIGHAEKAAASPRRQYAPANPGLFGTFSIAQSQKILITTEILNLLG